MIKNVIAGSTLALLLFCSTAFAQKPVEVTECVSRDVSLSLKLVGAVEPFLSTTVSSAMAGQVEEVLVEEGEPVREGQVLARLNRDVIQVRLVQAEARREQARGELDRTQKLVEQDLISLQKLQQVQTNLVLRSADFDLAQIQFEKTEIRSPFTGFVARRHTEIGEWIHTGGPVADLIRTDSVYVATTVSEQHVRHIRRGLSAKIRCDARPDVLFDGTIHRLVPEADPHSHAFPMKIAVANPDGHLKSGMFARVDLAIDRAQRLVLVMKDAVVNVAGEHFVFAVEEDHARRVRVKKGRSEADYVVVEGDVRPGAMVVVTGNESLRDKAEVTIVKRYAAR